MALIGAALACVSGPVPLGRPAAGDFDASRGRRVMAEGCGFMLFAFIPIRINSRFERTNAALLQQAGSDYVTDVRMQEKWTYALVGTVHCTVLQATAYPAR